MSENTDVPQDNESYIFRPYITDRKTGKRKYRPDGKMWKIKIRNK